MEPAIAEMNVSYLAGSTLALTCGYCVEALLLADVAMAGKDDAALRFERFARYRLGGLLG